MTWNEREAKTANKGGKPSEGGVGGLARVNRLIESHRGRIDMGIRRNLLDARYYWCMDQAFDVCQKQVTSTLVQGLLSGKMSDKDVESALQEWGLSSGLTTSNSPQGKFNLTTYTEQPKQKLDLPAFFNIFVPLAMSYVKARWAKIANDLEQWPVYKYNPARVNKRNKLVCDIITDRVQRMAEEMGYATMERQEILSMLMYGFALSCPMEDYWTSNQTVYGVDGQTEEQISEREGVRFYNPHASRTFWDMSHPLWTLNTDTGCTFFGYWSMRKASDIMDDTKLWNRERLTWGENAWPNTVAYRLFQELYPCVVNFPEFRFMQGAGDLDRERNAFVYRQTERDAGVNITVLYDKIVPSHWGLYDYDKPVWHMFIYGAQDTVMGCTPLAYCPGCVKIYDGDSNRYRQTSLVQELVPFQDHLSNLMSQYILSLKNNLANLIFVNRDVLPKDEIEKLRNLGEKTFRGINIVGFSEKELAYKDTDVRKAFEPVQFTKQNLQEIQAAISTLLSLLERCLGFSAQEVASQATHEQTAGEVRIIAGATQDRLKHTEASVIDSREARKRILFTAFMAYGSDDIFFNVEQNANITPEELAAVGFVYDQGIGGYRGGKSSLRLDSFASDRDGGNAPNNDQMVVAMLKVFEMVAGNQNLVGLVGPQQLLEKFNDILNWMGVPGDWRFDPAVAQQPDQIAQEVMKVIQPIIGNLTQSIKQVTDGIEAKVGATNEQVSAQSVQLTQLARMLTQSMEPQPAPAAPSQAIPQ